MLRSMKFNLSLTLFAFLLMGLVVIRDFDVVGLAVGPAEA